jgi:hypothetical protein
MMTISLGHIFPLTKGDYVANVRLLYSVPPCKLCLIHRFGEESNLSDLIGGQLRVSSAMNIFFMRDCFKVVGVDARPISALMVNLQKFWNWSIHVHPVPNVRVVVRSILSDVPVPALGLRSIPNPAGSLVPSVLNVVSRGGHASLVPMDALNMRPANKDSVLIRFLGNGGCLTAAASAQTGRIRDILGIHSALLSLSGIPRLYHQRGGFRSRNYSTKAV